MPSETKQLVDELHALRSALNINSSHLKMLTEKLDRLKDVKL